MLRIYFFPLCENLSFKKPTEKAPRSLEYATQLFGGVCNAVASFLAICNCFSYYAVTNGDLHKRLSEKPLNGAVTYSA
jgi:hypothetical protein